MEWVFLVAAILAFPVIAIIALVKAQGAERELRRVDAQLSGVQRELRALSEKIGALREGAPDAGPVQAPTYKPVPQAFARPIVRESVPEAPVGASAHPADAFASAGSPPPPAAPPKAAPGLEESLTSRWFVWLGAVAVALAGTFLVKYTIDEGWLGPAARCALFYPIRIRCRAFESAIATPRSTRPIASLKCRGEAREARVTAGP